MAALLAGKKTCLALRLDALGVSVSPKGADSRMGQLS
jgi:hypothetical protein